MFYIVNGSLVSRARLIARVYDACASMPEDLRPVAACVGDYTLEHNVRVHACLIARRLGWNPVSVIDNVWYDLVVKGHSFKVQRLADDTVRVCDVEDKCILEYNPDLVASIGGFSKAVGKAIGYFLP